MAARRKVIVAGAGVLGLSTALALADEGFEVVVHDPAGPGANASGVAAGMLAPALEAVLDPSARPHLDILSAARDLWPTFAARVGIQLDRSGALAVGGTDWIEAIAAPLAGLGVQARPMGRAALERAAPGLAPELKSGLLVDGDWRVDALPALAGLRRALEAAGVVFHATAAPRPEGGTLLVVATGAAQNLTSVAPELAVLTPIKGHILRAPGAIAQVLRGEGIYMVPTAGGVLIGATMEPGRDDLAVEPAQTEALRGAAARLIPGLAEGPVQALVGIRAATADGLPLAGPSAAPGVFVAAGARRNGWLLAPLVAQAVATLAMGREPGRWASSLAPGRFSPRG
jgi:glycine oxidase